MPDVNVVIGLLLVFLGGGTFMAARRRGQRGHDQEVDIEGRDTPRASTWARVAGLSILGLVLIIGGLVLLLW